MLLLTATVLAVVVAVRSTWSPCGLSMLSSITPLTEAGRGASYRTSAAWFVAGATLGGLTLGAGTAVLAALVPDLDASVALGVVGVAAALVAASDAGLLPRPLWGHTRQVNEQWLDQFRPWVYGGGFGWQIGVGYATFTMTAALHLFVLEAALAGPAAAVALGALFGFVRGLAILLGARITSPAALVEFHRTFDRWREPVRVATVAVAATIAAAAGGAAAGIVGFVALGAVGVAATVAAYRASSTPRSAATTLGPIEANA